VIDVCSAVLVQDDIGRHRPTWQCTDIRCGATESGTEWCRKTLDDNGQFALLIRGFGVRVPGGAPVIKALNWWFSPDQSFFHVQCGRLGARGVLWSRWTKPAVGGPGGLDSTIRRRRRRAGGFLRYELVSVGGRTAGARVRQAPAAVVGDDGLGCGRWGVAVVAERTRYRRRTGRVRLRTRRTAR